MIGEYTEIEKCHLNKSNFFRTTLISSWRHFISLRWLFISSRRLLSSQNDFLVSKRFCFSRQDNFSSQDEIFNWLTAYGRWGSLGVGITNSIMMLVKFLTSANQKHRIWSFDESGLCNPRPRRLGDEVVVGPSLMCRKIDPWNVIRNILQDKTNKNQL